MIHVFCGPAPRNGKPVRVVVLRTGDGREYQDKIDVDSGFQRQALLQRAAGQFDLAVDELRFIRLKRTGFGGCRGS